MASNINLSAYFERIRWGGSARPCFETLAGLLDAHMSNIPFKNLDVLLGRPIRLDLDGVQAKIVRARRGGYCFEHGILFAAVLEALEFQPIRQTARVALFAPPTASPRTHMFLRVPVEGGEHIVDPGFGGLAPPVPVPPSKTSFSSEFPRFEARHEDCCRGPSHFCVPLNRCAHWSSADRFSGM